MEYKFKAGDWVEVNVNDDPLRKLKPEWVKAQIKGLVSYGRKPPAPAYIFTNEPKPGYGTIYLEAFVRPLEK
jgi:hypothetical protein